MAMLAMKPCAYEFRKIRFDFRRWRAFVWGSRARNEMYVVMASVSWQTRRAFLSWRRYRPNYGCEAKCFQELVLRSTINAFFTWRDAASRLRHSRCNAFVPVWFLCKQSMHKVLRMRFHCWSAQAGARPVHHALRKQDVSTAPYMTPQVTRTCLVWRKGARRTGEMIACVMSKNMRRPTRQQSELLVRGFSDWNTVSQRLSVLRRSVSSQCAANAPHTWSLRIGQQKCMSVCPYALQRTLPLVASFQLWAAMRNRAIASMRHDALMAATQHHSKRQCNMIFRFRKHMQLDINMNRCAQRSVERSLSSDAMAAVAAFSGNTAEVLVFGSGGLGQLGCGQMVDRLAPFALPGLAALKIHVCACGEHHSAMLTMNGEIYTFGAGHFGVLGHGSEEKCSSPRRVDRLANERTLSVACGWRHTTAITATRELYSWGRGTFGQLGHGGEISFMLPLSVASHQEWMQVGCGWMHTAALTVSGTAFTWGDGRHLQLGHADSVMQSIPQVVERLAMISLTQIACGPRHCIAASTAGEVYTWGCGSHGELGHGQFRCEAVPRVISALLGVHVVRVACGGHSLALTADGWVFSWGSGEYGQLGHGSLRHQCIPRRVETFCHKKIVGISCGAFHSIAITDDNNAYTWGNGVFGALGHGSRSHLSMPQALTLSGNVAHVACGASHNLLVISADPRNNVQ